LDWFWDLWLLGAFAMFAALEVTRHGDPAKSPIADMQVLINRNAALAVMTVMAIIWPSLILSIVLSFFSPSFWRKVRVEFSEKHAAERPVKNPVAVSKNPC
jgi:hypothetical protein